MYKNMYNTGTCNKSPYTKYIDYLFGSVLHPWHVRCCVYIKNLWSKREVKINTKVCKYIYCPLTVEKPEKLKLQCWHQDVTSFWDIAWINNSIVLKLAPPWYFIWNPLPCVTVILVWFPANTQAEREAEVHQCLMPGECWVAREGLLDVESISKLWTRGLKFLPHSNDITFVLVWVDLY